MCRLLTAGFAVARRHRRVYIFWAFDFGIALRMRFYLKSVFSFTHSAIILLIHAQIHNRKQRKAKKNTHTRHAQCARKIIFCANSSILMASSTATAMFDFFGIWNCERIFGRMFVHVIHSSYALEYAAVYVHLRVGMCHHYSNILALTT